MSFLSRILFLSIRLAAHPFLIPVNMYPISQQPSANFYSQYYQQFADDTSWHPAPSSDYCNGTRQHSIETYGLAEDASIALNYSYPPIQPYDYSEMKAQMHLHAPVPVPYGLPHVANPSRQIHTPYVEQTYYSHHVPYPPFLHQTPGPTTTNTNIDYDANAPQLLLPTPSELPTDLSIPFAQISTTFSSSLSHPTQHEQSQSSERSNEPSTSAAPNTNKTESRREALQRTVAEEIGFIPTNP